MMGTPLRARVEHNREKLTEADQRLLDVLLREPAHAALLSASDLARETGVHAASAVRLAQKLGYTGYPDLRSALRDEFVASDGARRVAATLTGAQDNLLASLVRSEMEALSGLLNHVDQAALEAAAATLLRARSIAIFAQGNATVLVELLDRRLRRAGLRTVVASGQGRELAEHLVGLRRDDVLVAFAFRRLPRELEPALEHARKMGAKSVVIADQVARRLQARVDHVLAAPRGNAEEFLTLTVPMAICNALVLTIASIDNGQSVSTLDALEKLSASLTDN
jgi:DNA-binding MurR/RpiR family transcriptional regulator